MIKLGIPGIVNVPLGIKCMEKLANGRSDETR